MDDEFELEGVCDSPPSPELNCPEMWERRALVTAVSASETSDGGSWGKNERCEAGILRISGIASRDAVDEDGPVL